MAQTIIDKSSVKQIAGLQLNAHLFLKILPVDIFDRATLVSTPTPIYDINGDVLFYRVGIKKGAAGIGFIDIAANTAFSHPLLSVSYGQAWDEKSFLEQATSAVKKQRKEIKFNKTRFVAYSYPKLAVQFLLNDLEVEMLEWVTWQHVPEKRTRGRKEPPSNFERWSLIEETSPKQHTNNLKKFNNYMKQLDKIYPILPKSKTKKKFDFNPVIIGPAEFIKILPYPYPKPIPLTVSRELHYSNNNADHHPCYELRGQLTNVWCVGASVQMVLDFYRYNYAQTRVAAELGLGTLDDPNGLPYSECHMVVDVLELLTSNALDAHMNTTPTWNEFVTEINNNRPIVSFIPGHSRTVAGYTYNLFPLVNFRGLLVYDPWPPTTGVITRWENFATTSYMRTFTAHVTLV